MKIKQLFTTQQEREIDVETPSFYNDYSSMVAVYSEDLVISVLNLSNGFVNISKCQISNYRNFIELVTKRERITEKEFLDAYDQALSKIEIPVPQID